MEAFTSFKTIQLSHICTITSSVNLAYYIYLQSTVKFCSTKIYYKSPGIFTWALTDKNEDDRDLKELVSTV